MMQDDGDETDASAAHAIAAKGAVERGASGKHGHAQATVVAIEESEEGQHPQRQRQKGPSSNIMDQMAQRRRVSDLVYTAVEHVSLSRPSTSWRATSPSACDRRGDSMWMVPHLRKRFRAESCALRPHSSSRGLGKALFSAAGSGPNPLWHLARGGCRGHDPNIALHSSLLAPSERSLMLSRIGDLRESLPQRAHHTGFLLLIHLCVSARCMFAIGQRRGRRLLRLRRWELASS